MAGEVVLHLDAGRAVVIRRPYPPVDFGGREDDAAPLAERDEAIHDVAGGGVLIFCQVILKDMIVWNRYNFDRCQQSLMVIILRLGQERNQQL